MTAASSAQSAPVKVWLAFQNSIRRSLLLACGPAWCPRHDHFSWVGMCKVGCLLLWGSKITNAQHVTGSMCVLVRIDPCRTGFPAGYVTSGHNASQKQRTKTTTICSQGKNVLQRQGYDQSCLNYLFTGGVWEGETGSHRKWFSRCCTHNSLHSKVTHDSTEVACGTYSWWMIDSDLQTNSGILVRKTIFNSSIDARMQNLCIRIYMRMQLQLMFVHHVDAIIPHFKWR